MRAWKYALLIPLAVGLLTAAYERTQTDHLMVDAAKNYLVSLNPDQRKLTSFALDNMDERTHWLYTPFLRHGLTLREMTQTQRNLAEALVAAGLSSQGLVKAHTIMSLEEILFILEQNGDMERDPGKYFVSIFGEPSEHGVWGYRFEGHHVSLNYTIVDGKIASSPSFFGSNPAKILDGRRKGLRALAREDDLGYKLVGSLTGEQRAVAVVDKEAPGDITHYQHAQGRVDRPAQWPGLLEDDRAAERSHGHADRRVRQRFSAGDRLPTRRAVPPLARQCILRLVRSGRTRPEALLPRADA